MNESLKKADYKPLPKLNIKRRDPPTDSNASLEISETGFSESRFNEHQYSGVRPFDGSAPVKYEYHLPGQKYTFPSSENHLKDQNHSPKIEEEDESKSLSDDDDKYLVYGSGFDLKPAVK